MCVVATLFTRKKPIIKKENKIKIKPLSELYSIYKLLCWQKRKIFGCCKTLTSFGVIVLKMHYFAEM